MVTTTFDGEPATDVLAPADQAVFALQRATGAGSAIQYVWTYRHRVDLEALRRFHDNLRIGRLSHRIRLSALPFGPPRWVSGHADRSYLRVSSPRAAATAREWLDDQARTPLDPERGPAWRLSVLPFSEGGAVVSLVVSRCIADGAGLNLAVTEAIAGWRDDCDWPAAASRRSARILLSDITATACQLPTVARAALAASRTGTGRVPTTDGMSGMDGPIDLPTATVTVDAAKWDRRAETLGGSPATLVTAMAAEVARRLGRTDDGIVDLRLAVSERVSSDDTRANAVDHIDVPVHPDTDMATLRTDIQQALRRHRKVHDARAEFVPPPLRVIRKAPSVVVGGLHKVVVDNVGESHPILRRPDGTDAETVYLRTLHPRVTTATLHRIGGVMSMTSGRIGDRVFISVVAYQPGRDNTQGALHRIIADALASLGVPRSDDTDFLPGIPRPADPAVFAAER